MIIKIDIDEGVDVFDSMRAVHESVVDLYDTGSKITVVNGIKANIIEVSKEGNIFINVSKVEEK